MKWSPIESACKYGDPILLEVDGYVGVGFWMGDPERNHWKETGWFFAGDDVLCGHPENPTHWMSLPNPLTKETLKALNDVDNKGD